MANQTPDIRILVGNRGGASASGESAVLIRSNLEKALSSGIKIKVDVDKSQLGQLKKQFQGIASDIKVGVGTSSGSGIGKLPTDKDVATLVKLDKAFADAKLRLAQFNNYLQTVNPKGLKEYAVQITAIRDGFSSGDPLRIKAATAGMTELKAAMKSAGYEGGNAFTYLGAKIKTFATYLASSALTMGVVTGVRNIINTVKELDGSLTDLRIVTGGTREETQRLLGTYNQMAQELGSTTAAVSTSAVEWQRQGYNLADTNTLLKDSMVLSIVGFMDEADAATSLTAAIKGYQLSVEQAMSVVDKFTSVDLVAASSAGTLAEALAKTAANANLAGLSLDDVIAQLAVVNETLQEDGSQTGTFYNTMLSRMGNLKSGRLSDPETDEDLSNVESTLRGLDIQLRESNSEFRNFGDVLDEVGERWASFSSVQQRAIATAFAGTRQQTRFLSLMQGWEQAQKYAEQAANSAGTAMEKFGAYQEGLEFKTQRATAAFEAMSTSILDSGLIGGLMDVSTGLFNFVAETPDATKNILLLSSGLAVLAASINGVSASIFGNTAFGAIADWYKKMQVVGAVADAISSSGNIAKVSLSGMGAAAKEATLAQIAQIATAKEMNKSDLFAALTKAGLTREEKKNIAAKLEATGATGATTVATTTNTAATVGATVATKSFTTALIGLGTTMKTAILSHPYISALLAITVAVAAVIAINDALTVSLKEQQETTAKLRTEYEEISSTIAGYNAELDTTKARIDELLRKDSLSFAEQEELDRLKLQNDYLEQQVKLLEDQKRLKGQAVNDSVQAEYEMGFQKVDGEERYYSLYNTRESVYGYTAGEAITKEQYYDELIRKSKELRDAGLFGDELDGVNEKIRSIALDYSELASKIEIVDDASQKQWETFVADMSRGQRAIEGDYWSSALTDKLDSVLDNSAFAEAKNALMDLAKQGKVTAETFDDPAYDEFKEALLDAGIISGTTGDALSELVSHLNVLGAGKDHVYDLTASLGDLSDGLDAVVNAFELVKSVQEEVHNTGKLTASTLADILERFGEGASTDLTSNVAEYIAGLRTSAQLLDDLRAAYQKDESAFLDGIKAKLSVMPSFYDGLSQTQKLAVDELSKQYDVDLENFKTVEKKKLEAQSQIIRRLAENYSIYNGKSVEYLRGMERMLVWDDERGDLDAAGKAELAEIRKTIRLIDSFSAALDGIVYDGVSVDIAEFSKSVSSSSKTISAYTVEIDRLRDALKQLEDVEQALATAQAKLDLLPDKNMDVRAAAIRNIISLHQQEQAELHNVNQARRKLIQETADKLSAQGFQVQYDPDHNDFWVQNLEHLNELGAGLSTEKRNDLIKEYETLISQAEKWNEENVKGSLEWLKIQDTIQGLQQDMAKDQLDNLEKLVDLTRDMIKQEKEDLIDALESQKDAYSDLIDLKKKSLELTEHERSYSENVNDKTKEISKLQARIDALGLDDSRSAQAERGALLEQLAEKQRDLDDLQREHSITSQQEALDQEQKDFENTKDKEIKKIRDFLNDNEAMTKAALSRIDAMNASTFDDLLSYSKHYTDTTGAELETMWDNAIAAAKQYGSVTDALSGLKKESGGDWNEPAVTHAVVSNKVKTMQSNSVGWKTASAGDRERLVAENERLAAEIEALLQQKLVRGADGEWYIGRVGGEKLYQKYHDGTPSVGAPPTPKQNELWALMQNKEMVLTQEHQDNLYDFLRSMVPKVDIGNLLSPFTSMERMFAGMNGGHEIRIDNRMYFDGYLPDDYILSAIERQRRRAGELLAGEFGA